MTLIGIDGCRAGWVCAVAESDLITVRFEVIPNVRETFGCAACGEAVVGIDMPIGLLDDGPRPCDLAARATLGPRQGSRVFPAPTRAALAGTSYAECCTLNRQARGVGLSKQSYGILEKIRQVDEAMTPGLQSAVREVHPEVTFCILNGAPLEHGKKTTAGQRECLAILKGNGIAFDPDAVRNRLGRSVEVDDVIDAAVCLLTTHRIQAGRQRVLGDGVVDARGLAVEIVA